MKKHAAQTVAPVQPKTARTLFGLSSKDLKAVCGGGGVIINSPRTGGQD
jgi:hypothetical protein